MADQHHQSHRSTQQVDNSIVLNSAINHHILSNTRHHVANTRHIMNTNQRINDGLVNNINTSQKIEKNMNDMSLDLDSYVDSLSLCTTVCKDSMTRSRLIIMDTVNKEKNKEKIEKTILKKK